MRRMAYALAVLGLLTSIARSNQLDRDMMLAEIGTIVGSEKACGLHFNQGALERFVTKFIEPEDLHFTSMFNIYVETTAYQLRNMSPAALTVHCAQIRQVVHQFELEY
jgi:hypothetical protein